MKAVISQHDICVAIKATENDVLYIRVMDQVGFDGKYLDIEHRHYYPNSKDNAVRASYPDEVKGTELAKFYDKWYIYKNAPLTSKKYALIRTDIDELLERIKDKFKFACLASGGDAVEFC